jgi:hypothetical protein
MPQPVREIGLRCQQCSADLPLAVDLRRAGLGQDLPFASNRHGVAESHLRARDQLTALASTFGSRNSISKYQPTGLRKIAVH